MLEYFKTLKEKFWKLFYRSGTILNASITAITGAVTAGIGALDWSPLYTFFGTSTTFSKEQVMGLGVVIAIKGCLDIVIRLANTLVTDSGKLVSKDITTSEVKSTKKAK